MNPDFGPTSPGGETGCAAMVVAVSAGAVDSSRWPRDSVTGGFVVDFCGHCPAPNRPSTAS